MLVVEKGNLIRRGGDNLDGFRTLNSRVLCRFREGQGMTEDEVAAFERYFYHITAADGSGEYALRHLLGPFAWARHPLEGRLQDLKVGFLQGFPRFNGTP